MPIGPLEIKEYEYTEGVFKTPEEIIAYIDDCLLNRPDVNAHKIGSITYQYRIPHSKLYESDMAFLKEAYLTAGWKTVDIINVKESVGDSILFTIYA